jgi:hypothetical protein
MHYKRSTAADAATARLERTDATGRASAEGDRIGPRGQAVATGLPDSLGTTGRVRLPIARGVGWLTCERTFIAKAEVNR